MARTELKSVGEAYECELCAGTFARTVDDATALERMKQRFGDIPEDERAMVCDVCFDLIMAAQEGEIQ